MKGDFKIKGTVKVFQNGKLLLQKANSIQSESEDIIRRGLGGYTSAKITNAFILNNDTLLAEVGMSQDPEFIGTNKVKFFFHFPKYLFEGVFNKVKMGTGLGIFSVMDGFENTKTLLQTLDIEWLIEINII